MKLVKDIVVVVLIILSMATANAVFMVALTTSLGLSQWVTITEALLFGFFCIPPVTRYYLGVNNA